MNIDNFNSIKADTRGCWSLRRLQRSILSVKLRRTSDNATCDFGWYNDKLDISTIEHWCNGSEARIHTWYDQSNNRNHAIQTTNESQPKLVDENGKVLMNSKGLPYIQFDENECLIVADNDTLDGGTGFGVNLYINTVFEYNHNESGYHYIVTKDNGSTSTYDYSISVSNAYLTFATGSFESQQVSFTDYMGYDTIVSALLHSTGSATGSKQLYINGASKSSVNYTHKASAHSQALFIGANSALDKKYVGKLQELILLGSNLTPAGIKRIELNQSKYYNIPINGVVS